MPAAIEYVPPTAVERQAYATNLAAERLARRRRYINALKYWSGKAPDQLEFDPETEPDDNVSLNLVRMTAERTISFLFPALPRFRTDKNDPNPTKQEEWLCKAIDYNGGLQTFTKLGLRGFLAGMTYMRIRQNPAGKGYPSMTVLDPLAITPFWHADDVGDILWYENRYIVGVDVYVQDYVRYPAENNWKIYTYRAPNAAAGAALIGDNTPNGAGATPRNPVLELINAASYELVLTAKGEKFALHNSNLPPIIEIPHLPDPDDYYGHGEVTQTDMQDTINRLWSEVNRIVRKHSEPTDVITGADVDDVEQGDNVMTVADKDARVQRLEMKGDMSAAVDTVTKLIETYLATARVVLLRGEVKDLQRVTNASVRTLFIDMLAKNELLRDSYGRGLRNAVRLMLQMSGEDFATTALDLDIECIFKDPLPVDLTEVANQNAIMVPMGGRSLRTAATAMGDDWTTETANKAAEMLQKIDELKQMQAALPQPTTPDTTPKPGEQAPKKNSEPATY